jgi:hypothetical protein
MLLPVLVGIALGATAAPSAPAPGVERHAVAYYHEAGGVNVQGMLGDATGAARSAWTVTSGEGKQKVEGAVAPARLQAILAGLDGPAFRLLEVHRSDHRLDFRAFRVVSWARLRADGTLERLRIFLVPARPEDPAVRAWLELLEVPVPVSAPPQAR